MLKIRFAFSLLLALTFFAFVASTEASAKPKRAKYGTIKIMTNPGGLLLTIDGQALGETTKEYRSIDLAPNRAFRERVQMLDVRA